MNLTQSSDITLLVLFFDKALFGKLNDRLSVQTRILSFITILLLTTSSEIARLLCAM